MWGKILVSLAFLIFVNCTATTTCNPNLANPGCPAKRSCDPTGICQLICDSSEQCTDPDATICDKSSTVAFLCQRDANSPSGCLKDETFLNLATTDAEKSQGINKVVCKKKCTEGNGQACVSLGARIEYTCQVPQAGQGNSYCWGQQSQQ